jgi:hypothetical protein
MSKPDETIGNALQRSKEVLARDGGCEQMVEGLLDVVDNDKVVRATQQADPNDGAAHQLQDAGAALAEYVEPGPHDCQETVEAVSEILNEDQWKDGRNGRQE